MAIIVPFQCIHPAPEYAAQVAALPYDVYNRKEAAKETAKHPLSFLNIDRPETQFPPDADMYAPQVYEKEPGRPNIVAECMKKQTNCCSRGCGAVCWKKRQSAAMPYMSRR